MDTFSSSYGMPSRSKYDVASSLDFGVCGGGGNAVIFVVVRVDARGGV
jgi:hypothetical protein